MAVVETVRFVASVLGVEPSQAELETDAIHLGSTCQAIAQRSSNSQQYLGSSVSSSAEILQWMLWAGTELRPLMDDKLLKVNKDLESRTYLVGSSLTLADLVIFGVTHPALTSFPAAQSKHFCNLLRWADHVQHTVGTDTVTKCFKAGAVTVTKPAFVAPQPPPPQPAAPAAAPAAAAGQAKGAAPAAAAPATGKPAPAAATGKDGKPAAAAAAAAAAGSKDAKAAAADGGKKADKAAGKEGDKGSKKDAGKKDDGGDDEARIDMLDIRVGTIVEVGKHPNADALYLEKIDIGEAEPRQVISGLVKFVPLEEMQGRRVLVVTNLKPAKMRDVMSYGMVLCASNDDHDKVVPVIPPAGVPNGERISVQGFDQEPLAEVNPKKKILERLFPDMKTNADGVPCYKGVPMTTSKGAVTSPLPSAWVK